VASVADLASRGDVQSIRHTLIRFFMWLLVRMSCEDAAPITPSHIRAIPWYSQSTPHKIVTVVPLQVIDYATRVVYRGEISTPSCAHCGLCSSTYSKEIHECSHYPLFFFNIQILTPMLMEGLLTSRVLPRDRAATLTAELRFGHRGPWPWST
jgi:hypothetical protein